MRTTFKPSDTANERSFVDAERCIAELQRGRAVVLIDESQPSPVYKVIQLVETLARSELQLLMESHSCQLVISRSRAVALNLMVDSVGVCLELAPRTDTSAVYAWAGLSPDAGDVIYSHASSRAGGYVSDPATTPPIAAIRHSSNSIFAKAALNLARCAHVLPAFIMYEVSTPSLHLLQVSATTAIKYVEKSGELITLSSARVPLATAQNVELTVFRERHGNAEHVAITVGEPDKSDTVTVRLHSSCFTGDILGSMKCDCGEQLQRAIIDMAEGDGGVVLYVSQEGRGIGLASKLLAYQLQDQGLDTIDANQHLGFEADERRYSAAVSMLRELGIDTIRLMTNNPLKIQALSDQGIKVDSRVPSPATVNAHNARYLETKRERAGHLACCESAG